MEKSANRREQRECYLLVNEGVSEGTTREGENMKINQKVLRYIAFLMFAKGGKAPARCGVARLMKVVVRGGL